MLRLLRDLFEVIVDTESFFREAKDRGKGEALFYFFFITLVALLINLLFLSQGIAPAGLAPFEKFLEVSSREAFLIPFIYFVGGFLFLGFFAFMLSNILVSMGIGTGFKGALNAISYSLTPAVLTMWFPVLGIIFLAWSFYMMAMGLRVFNKASLQANGKASILGGLLTGMLFVVSLLAIGYWILLSQGSDLALLWTVLLPF